MCLKLPLKVLLRRVTIHLLKEIGVGYSELKSLRVYADILLTEAKRLRKFPPSFYSPKQKAYGNFYRHFTHKGKTPAEISAVILLTEPKKPAEISAVIVLIEAKSLRKFPPSFCSLKPNACGNFRRHFTD